MERVNLGYVKILNEKCFAVLNVIEKTVSLLMPQPRADFTNYDYFDGFFVDTGYVKLYNVDQISSYVGFGEVRKFSFDFFVSTFAEEIEASNIRKVIFENSFFRENIDQNELSVFDIDKKSFNILTTSSFEIKLIEVIKNRNSKKDGVLQSSTFKDHQFQIEIKDKTFNIYDSLEIISRIKSFIFLLGFKDRYNFERIFVEYQYPQKNKGEVLGFAFTPGKKLNPFLNEITYQEFISIAPAAIESIITNEKLAFEMSSFMDLFLRPKTVSENHFLSLFTIIESLGKDNFKEREIIHLSEILKSFQNELSMYANDVKQFICDIKNTRNGLSHSNNSKINLKNIEFHKVIYFLELLIVFTLLKRMKIDDDLIHSNFQKSILQLKSNSFEYIPNKLSFFRSGNMN